MGKEQGIIYQKAEIVEGKEERIYRPSSFDGGSHGIQPAMRFRSGEGEGESDDELHERRKKTDSQKESQLVGS